MVDFHSQMNYRKIFVTISSDEKFASTHPASTYRYQSTIMSCVNLGQFLGEYRTVESFELLVYSQKILSLSSSLTGKKRS